MVRACNLAIFLDREEVNIDTLQVKVQCNELNYLIKF